MKIQPAQSRLHRREATSHPVADLMLSWGPADRKIISASHQAAPPRGPNSVPASLTITHPPAVADFRWARGAHSSALVKLGDTCLLPLMGSA